MVWHFQRLDEHYDVMIRLLFLRTHFFFFYIGLECSLSCRKVLALLDYACVVW